MKKLGATTLLILMVCVVLNGAERESGSDNIEGFVTLSENLKEAMNARNFHDAREIMDELLPMMKDDIKSTKKNLSTLSKEGTEEETVVYEQKYNRKVELYDEVKKYVEMSPAALRVKSDDVLTKVNEYVSLLEEESVE